MGLFKVVGAAIEAVGLDRVAANFKKSLVNLADNIRPAEVENLRGILMAHPVALQIERAQLQIGAHRSSEDNEPLFDQFEKRKPHESHLSNGNDEPHILCRLEAVRKLRGMLWGLAQSNRMYPGCFP